MRSQTLTIGNGSSCAFPREAYRPSDLTGEQHMALREGLYRTARYDGLDEDAADEAASQFYAHWLARDYTSLPYARGDHMRAYYAIRAYARRSQWRGFTGQRRAAKRSQTVEMIAATERARERAIPRPDALAMARETVETMPNGPIGRRLASLSRKAGAADLLAEAYGIDPTRGAFRPTREACNASPWQDDGGPVCNLTTRRRCNREPVFAADIEAHRAALAEYYATH